MNGKLLITLFLITLIMPFAQTTSVQAESLFDARGVKLFDDHRARMVGDILTVIVVESTSATSKGESKFDKKIDMKGGVKIEGFLDYLVPNFFEPIEPLKNLAINPEEKYDGSGETSSDNTFATRMT
ncbi:flagellar basal body L-ring protein FlgH, partial [bacterium]|nr:flagellar basal body L-ring protein FlgH [bacterium]MBU1024870.1 flagellar basal body L-ring protein FlgH [bacterium]